MSRPNPVVLFVTLALFVALIGGILLSKGGLFVTAQEGDTYHLLDVLLRMQLGLRPHVDFVTPLGIFAFLPMVWFLESDMGIGMAVLSAQVLVAALLLPLIWYAAWSRMPSRVAFGFAIASLWLVLALTYGTANANISISMHYNRWAWSISFIVLALVLLPPRGRAFPVLDGIIIGGLLATIVLLKITFFVGLAPAILVALVIDGRTRTLIWAISAGLVVGAIMMAFYGLGFWLAYFSDLLNVSDSEVRPHTGIPLKEIIAGPAYIGALGVGYLAAVFLRRAGDNRRALVLALLLPGFVFITWQNSGNDPQWLIFLIAAILTLRPPVGVQVASGMDMHLALTAVAIAAGAIFLPSALNLALSPIKHYAAREAQFQPMLPSRPEHSDIRVNIDRGNTMTAEVALDSPGSPWARYAEIVGRPSPLTLGGVEFPECELIAGSTALLREIGADLTAAGVPDGSQIYTTDILSSFWLFEPFAPLQNGAPWYYGDLSGIENADYVLVPKCSFLMRMRGIMVRELNAANLDLRLVRDNDLYALFALPQAPNNPISR